MIFPLFKAHSSFFTFICSACTQIERQWGAVVSKLIQQYSMAFLSSLLNFANEVLTFYLPIFFTFRYLSSQDHEKISRILKFWCVLSLAYIIQFVLAFILADNLDVLVDVALHVALIYDHFKYSQLIYDTLVSPFYKTHEETINSLSKKVEGYFEKKTAEVQSQVSQNATDKIRGFIGDILVGTLNPAGRGKQRRKESRSVEDDEREGEQQASDKED